MIVLKIILWIILAILLLAVVALCVPARFCVKYKDSVTLTVKYLFLTIPLVPRNKKKKKTKNDKKKVTDKSNDKKADNQDTAEKKQSEPQKKQSAENDDEDENLHLFGQIKDMYKQKGLDGSVIVIKELGNLITGTLKKVFKRVKLRKFDVDIAVSEENAADTAIKYGYVCAVVYPVVSLILNSVRFNDYSVDIAPNFEKKESEVNLYAEISIIPWFGVTYLLGALINFIKLKVKGIL